MEVRSESVLALFRVSHRVPKQLCRSEQVRRRSGGVELPSVGALGSKQRQGVRLGIEVGSVEDARTT